LNNNKKKYFPIFIDIIDFPALVIGGGKVALRKINSLLEFGAKVSVLSPKFSSEIQSLIQENKITPIAKSYQSGDVNGYRLVFCATDNTEVSHIVQKDCLENDILLNVADVPELCNFIMPAMIKRGDFIVALSSQGKAPFFVKEQRDKLDKQISPKLAEITELAGKFRSFVIEDKRFKAPQKQKLLFKNFLVVDWEKILNEEGEKAAYQKLIELLD
jgi:precorrin-2 dehydrogenase / sirohydrochlorin ferrochelatase